MKKLLIAAFTLAALGSCKNTEAEQQMNEELLQQAQQLDSAAAKIDSLNTQLEEATRKLDAALEALNTENNE